LNYSEYGCTVDGIFYCLDASNKSLSPQTPPSPLNSSNYNHQIKYRSKLESARNELRDKTKARLALEGALRLTIPASAQDDALLAEELSKSEGLMTRTGLKRVSVEAPSVVSIPLSKARKIELSESSKAKKQLLKSKPTPEKKPITKTIALPTVREPPVLLEPEEDPVYPARIYGTPCDCEHYKSVDKKQALEGTALVSHGSKLKFGCLEFVLSVAGCPGHNELLSALQDDT